MGKSLICDSARAGSQKQQKEASRRATPDARERIPPADTLGFFCPFGAQTRASEPSNG